MIFLRLDTNEGDNDDVDDVDLVGAKATTELIHVMVIITIPVAMQSVVEICFFMVIFVGRCWRGGMDIFLRSLVCRCLVLWESLPFLGGDVYL